MSENQYPHLRTSGFTVPSIETTACGKAIIVGEHAAVYGAHAVAIPLHQMRFRFHLSQRPLRFGQAPEVHLKLAGHEGSPRLQAVVVKAMDLLGIQHFSLDGETHSSLPIGAGLGSSATLCVAVLRALSEALQLQLGPKRLADLANELEKSFHGNPSGLDTAVVAFERPILFAKGEDIQIIPIQKGLRYDFILIDSNIRASTMSMIHLAKPFFTDHRGPERIARFDKLSLDTFESFKDGDIETLAGCMNECGKLLEEVGVVPPNLRDMIDQARNLGALAAKTTGAGGGGMIIGLLGPDDSERQFRKIKQHFEGHAIYRVTLNSDTVH